MGIIDEAMGNPAPMAPTKVDPPAKPRKVVKAKPRAKPATKAKKEQKGGIMGFNRS